MHVHTTCTEWSDCYLCAGGDDRFEVDLESGIVRTKGREPLRNMEYELGVSAEDISAKTLQKSPTHSLKILVGERDPQFFETQYVTSVPESATERYKWGSRVSYSYEISKFLFHIDEQRLLNC